MAVGRKIGIPLVVGEKDNDVRPRARLLLGARDGDDQADKDKASEQSPEAWACVQHYASKSRCSLKARLARQRSVVALRKRQHAKARCKHATDRRRIWHIDTLDAVPQHAV